MSAYVKKAATMAVYAAADLFVLVIVTLYVRTLTCHRPRKQIYDATTVHWLNYNVVSLLNWYREDNTALCLCNVFGAQRRIAVATPPVCPLVPLVDHAKTVKDIDMWLPHDILTLEDCCVTECDVTVP